MTTVLRLIRLSQLVELRSLRLTLRTEPFGTEGLVSHPRLTHDLNEPGNGGGDRRKTILEP
jgi:hypothetical protein